MIRIKKSLSKLSKVQKTKGLIFIVVLTLLLSILIPSLARYKNRNTIVGVSVWDGSVATKYRSGTGSVDDPYIISNGSELAYFSHQLKDIDYSNTYFKLNGDIVLNDGVFNYISNSEIKYILNDTTYYLNSYSTSYYDNKNFDGNKIGDINSFDAFNNFKGHFDGNSHTIYGLYMASENSKELALFTNLEGEIKNLYVENSLIHGGNITSGVVSTAKNSSLSNILYDGYVIGNSNFSTKTITVNVENQQLLTEENSSINLTLPLIYGQIISSSLSGNCIIDNEESIVSINNQQIYNGSFDVDLGSSLLTSIPVSKTPINTIVEFTNLVYTITYKYSTASGIVAVSQNTEITNSINKAEVYGSLVSGGLVGIANSTNISQSYNNGIIKSDDSSGGLIGIIKQSNSDILIERSYNAGSTNSTNSGGLIGNIESNETITISKTFNATNSNYVINSVNDSVVTVNNSYAISSNIVNIGSINGSFVTTDLSNLKNENYLTTKLEFNAFIDNSYENINSHKVWVYEEDSLPILFMDDITNPIANIHANTYSWNNFSDELNSLRIDSSITFNIEQVSNLKPIKNIYYYVYNSNVPLKKNQIEQINIWQNYTSLVNITEEGFYIVYAKVVDYNNKITYLNTDVLVLDLTGANLSINLDNKHWTSASNTLNKLYINEDKIATIDATDDLSGISSVEYYISSSVLNEIELNSVDWIKYSNGISINQTGKHILYVKVVDNCDHIIFANTDYIVYDGYTQESLRLDRDGIILEDNRYITDKSIITLNTSYSSDETYLDGYSHKLVSSILLPVGSQLTLIDNVNNKVFQYKITSDEDLYNYNSSCPLDDTCTKFATYPLNLFTEVGKMTNNQFSENSYYDKAINENFSIILDLSDTDIDHNYTNVSLYMQLCDSDNNSVGSTFINSIKSFDIYSNNGDGSSHATIYLSTSFNSYIELNSNSSTNIPIATRINYKYINGIKINDTSYTDKIIGISLKMIDNNNNIISKENYKNMKIKIGSSIYYPDNNDMIYLNLNNGILDTNTEITIVTSEDNTQLATGNYQLLLTSYAAYDGLYSKESNNTISIPIVVSNGNDNKTYGFDVLNDDTRIINKSNGNLDLSFNILQNGLLHNPNIRVSLYKKKEFTPHNQDYIVVDLANYVNNSLVKATDNSYYVATSPLTYNGTSDTYNNFILNLIVNNFESNGYKLVFELYNSNAKVGKVEKFFIVK